MHLCTQFVLHTHNMHLLRVICIFALSFASLWPGAVLPDWFPSPTVSQDVMQFSPLVSTIGRQMAQDPLLVPDLLRHVGPGGAPALSREPVLRYSPALKTTKVLNTLAESSRPALLSQQPASGPACHTFNPTYSKNESIILITQYKFLW
jgi:hypothetical protein